MRLLYLFLLIGLGTSCQNSTTDNKADQSSNSAEAIPTAAPIIEEKIEPIEKAPIQFDYDTSVWYDLADFDETIVLDLRYATTNNFVKEVMYDCGRCFLRKEVARAVIKAHQDLINKGYGGFKMFDCYRPRPIQWKLWNKVPNPTYVADPRKGSQHNRGTAIDLTIIDKEGEELDMGTEFDFFGKEAHHDYTGHSTEVNANRQLLKDVMGAQGFRWIRTEWWHYSYKPKSYPISDMLWECN